MYKTYKYAFFGYVLWFLSYVAPPRSFHIAGGYVYMRQIDTQIC